MSEFNASRYFDNLAAKEADTTLSPNAWQGVQNRLTKKQQDVAETSRRKVEAMRENERTVNQQDQWDSVAGDLGTGSDIVRETVEGGVKGVGAVFGGIGDGIEAAGKGIEDVLGAVGLGDEVQAANEFLGGLGVNAPSEGFQGVENWMNQGAENIDQSQDMDYRQSLIDSTPGGDVTDPSTWTLGENPSAEGYAGHIAGIIGGFAPQAATLLAGSPTRVATAMATVGGAQVGGSQANEAETRIKAASQEELSQIGMYQDLIKEGVSHEDAVEQTSKAAGAAAFMAAAPVGAVGGAATSYILGPLQKQLAGNIAGRTAGSVALSGTEEATQEVSETVAARAGVNAAIGDDQDLTADTFADALLGGGFGAGLGVAGTTASELQRAGQKRADKEDKKAAERRATNGTISELMAAGDVDTLVDPEAGKRFKAEDVAQAAVVASTTAELDQEVQNNGKKILPKIGERLETELENLKADEALRSPEAETKNKGLLKKAQQLKARETKAGNSVGVEQANEMIGQLTEELKATRDEDKAVKKERTDRIEAMESAIARVNVAQRNLSANASKSVDVDSLISIVETPETDAVEKSSAAQEIITQAMANPDVLTEDTALRLADDSANGLTEKQRGYLRSLSQSKVAANELKDYTDVVKDIFSANPSTGFKSLPQYRSSVQRGLTNGSTDRVAAELAQLGRFSESHQAKAALARQAFDGMEPGQKQAQIVHRDGGWEMNTGKPMSDKQLRENGGLSISTGSQRLVEGIEREAQVIEAARQELEAATAVTTPTEQPEAVSDNETADVDAQADQNADQETENETDQTQSDQPAEEATAPETSTEAEPETGTVTSAEPERASEDTEVRDRADDGTRDFGTTVEGRGGDTGREESVEPEAPAKSVLFVDQGTFEPYIGQTTVTEFTSMNLVQAYFTTKKGLPLTANKDFLSETLATNLDNPEALPVEFSDRNDTRDKQQGLVRYFAETATKWNQTVDALFQDKKRKDFRHENLVTFFAENGQLDENTKTAISTAAFTWAVENGNDLWYNDEDAIRKILGLGPQDVVTDNDRLLVGDVGTRDKLVIQDLGQRVTQALGQRISKDAPINHQAQLEGAFGAIALAVLQEQGYVQRIARQNAAFGTDQVNEEGKLPLNWFVRSNRITDSEGNTQFNPMITGLTDRAKGTQQIVHDLFRVESQKTGPVDTAPKKVQDTTRRTDQKVPKEQRKILEAAMAQEHWLRADMLDAETGILNKLPRALVDAISGVEATEDRLIHKANRSSLDAKNESIVRGNDYMYELANDRSDRMDQPFFFDRSVWRQQRVGIKSNTFNPQASKVHRFVIKMVGWDYDVPVALTGESGQRFKLAVLESLGVKTDKQGNAKSLGQWDTTVNDPEVRAAVEALKKFSTGQTTTQADQDAILAGVQRGGEDFHSFDGLWHLAQVELAETTGETNFTATLVREGDGVTNGPMFAQLQTGALFGRDGMGAKGGFFTKADAVQDYGVWAQEGSNHDLYETLANAVAEKMEGQRSVDSGSEPFYNFLDKILGQFRDVDTDAVTGKGRKRVKTPLTAMVFGAGKEKSIANMGHEFVDLIYDNIQDILDTHDNDRDARASIETLFSELNGFLPKSQQIGIRPTRKNAADLEFSAGQRETLVGLFEGTIGQHIDNALEDQYGEFLSRRKRLNDAAGLSFKLYKLVYDAERRAMMQELEGAGTMPVNKKGEPLQDLTKAQEQELNKRVEALSPLVHTALSKGGSRDAGLKMAKIQRSMAPADQPRWNGKVTFKKHVPLNADANVDTLHKSVRKDSRKEMDFRAVVQEETDPGVAPLIMLIHSMDSAIISRVYKNANILNVHDAAIGSPEQLETVMRSMNQETLNALIEYSVPEEVMQALYHTLLSFNERAGDFEQDAQFQADYKALKKELKAEPGEKAGELLKAATDMDQEAMQWAQDLEYVNQYGYEGSAYHVQDSDRQRIKDRLKTPMKDRIIARLGKAKLANPEQVSGDLARYLEKQEAAFVAQVEAGNNMTASQRNEVRVLRLVNEVFIQTGDLNQALGRVLPGTKNKAERGRLRGQLIQILGSNNAKRRDVRHAPAGRVVDMIQSAEAGSWLSESVKADLGRVKEALLENPMDVAGTLRASTRTDADHAAVMAYLQRAYNGRRETSWGTLGTPRSNSSEALVQAMTQTPVMKAKDLYPHLRKALQEMPKGPSRSALGQVLLELRDRIDPELEVRYITQDTPASLAPESVTGARGFFHQGEGGRYIAVKGPDFVESNLTPELLAHELIHSVVSADIKKELAAQKRNKNHKSNLTPLVNDLERVRQKAEELVVNDTALQAKYGNAVKDVDEMVAWGMSNAGFQQEVLSQFEVETQTQNNRFVTGMQSFIKTLANILFRKSATPAQQNGLNVVINNASGLFAAVADSKATTVEVTAKQETPDPFGEVDKYTTEDIYNALDGEPDGRLQSVMDQVITHLHGPYGGIKALVDRQTGNTAEDVYLNAMITGELPFASRAIASGLVLSDKQAFVLEQSEVTMQTLMDGKSLASKDMVRLFRKTRSELSAKDFHDGDWALATDTEKAKAHQTYDFIFKLNATDTESRSDHLSRFAALALTYPPLYQKMNFPVTPEQGSSSAKMGERIQSWFNDQVQRFANEINKTYSGQEGRARMDALVKRLVQIEARKKAKIASGKVSLLDQIEEANNNAAGSVRSRVANLARSERFSNSDSPIVRAASKTTALGAENRLGELLNTMEDFRNSRFPGRQGLAASAMSEVRGTTESNKVFHELLNEAGKNERERKQRIESVKQQILESFGEDGESLTDTQRSDLTRVLLKTDLSALLADDRFTVKQLTNLVDNTQNLDTTIAEAEGDLAALGPNAAYYKNAAEALGHFMATGEVLSPNLMLNVHNIANKVGMSDANTVAPQDVEAAKAILDPLVSLYALRATGQTQQQTVKRLMQHQQERGQQSGVFFMLKLHQSMKDEAKRELFDNDPALFTKGYIKEIYNPHHSVVAADSVDGEALEKAGYSKGAEVPRDPADPDQTVKHLYMTRDGGLQGFVTGSISYTGSRAKGSKLHSGLTRVTEEGVHRKNQKTNAEIQQNKAAAIASLNTPGAFARAKKDAQGNLVPIVNPAGDVVNYRYLMSEGNKDSLLDRDLRVDNVMGAMAGSIYDKPKSADQNREVIQALKDQFDAEGANNPNAYMEFSPDSDDLQIRETYALLPDSTKKAIKDTWGRNGLMVRSDVMDMVFGYRKASLANVYDRQAAHDGIMDELTNGLANAFVTGTTAVFGDKAAYRIRQGEDVWQELVKELKDIYVIKNLWTLLGNISSNVSLLLWHGVSPSDLVRDHKIAIEGLLNYQRNHEELMKLERLRDTGTFSGNQSDVDQRILELQHSMNNNPVKELLDAGQFQTIIEDIDAETDQFSYKSKLVDWTENKTAKLPSSVKTAGKTLFMAHDTPLYKLLHRSTAMSDFVGRYTLYQHLTTKASKGKEPMEKGEAMHKIKQAFVNYDVPTHRTLQYLNDTGLVFFTKYYMRIQRVLMELYQDKPVRALLMILFSQFVSNVPAVQDSAFFGRIGNNPFDTGALGLPGGLDETIVMQTALSPFN